MHRWGRVTMAICKSGQSLHCFEAWVLLWRSERLVRYSLAGIVYITQQATSSTHFIIISSHRTRSSSETTEYSRTNPTQYSNSVSTSFASATTPTTDLPTNHYKYVKMESPTNSQMKDTMQQFNRDLGFIKRTEGGSEFKVSISKF